MGTVDRWHVCTGIDRHNDGVLDDHAGGGESGDGGGDAYGGEGSGPDIWQPGLPGECHSRNCTSCTARSAIVGTEGVL